MNIYLIRHGDAEKAVIGKKDFDRELTQSGKLKMKLAAQSWKNLIEKFDLIISSPLIRTLQTANIIAEVYEVKSKSIIDKKLSPGSRSESIIELANAANVEDIAFVGHQPDMSEILSDLISSKGVVVDFKKGAVAKISFHNKAHISKGVLEFLVPASAYNNLFQQNRDK